MEYKEGAVSKQVWLFAQKLTISSLLIISFTAHAFAEDLLDYARIEKVKETVYQSYGGKERRIPEIKSTDKKPELNSGDKVRTDKKSGATLLFDNKQSRIHQKPYMEVSEYCLFTFKSNETKSELEKLGNYTVTINNNDAKCATFNATKMAASIDTSVSRTILSNSQVKVATKSKNNKISQDSNNVQTPLKTPLERKASVVMIEHDSVINKTTIFALTDGIQVYHLKEGGVIGKSVTLLGGQKVSVTREGISKVEEENLLSFYANSELAKNFKPGQDISNESPDIQNSIKAVQGDISKAINAQDRRLTQLEQKEKISTAFLNSSQDLHQSKKAPSPLSLNPKRTNARIDFGRQTIEGTFQRPSENQIIFRSNEGGISPIEIDIRRNGDTITLRAFTLNGIRYTFGQGGQIVPKGSDLTGTAFNDNGESIQINVNGVDREPPPGETRYSGSITTGIQVDRSVPGSYILSPPRDK